HSITNYKSPITNFLFVQRRPALLTDSHLAFAAYFMPNSHWTARRTHQGHVRQRNRPLLLGNSTLDVALRIRPHVLLHRHHVLHQHLALVGQHPQHAPFFSRIPPGHHLHGVIPADIHSFVFGRYCSHKNLRFQSFKVSSSRSQTFSRHLETLKH